jgi:hypothetical protein
VKGLLLALVAFASLGMSGCQTGHVPNPNDPDDVGPLSPDTLRRNLSAVTDSLSTREAKKEFGHKAYQGYVAKAASELLESVDATTIKPEQAWEYGEVLRDAQQWADAEPVLELAVKYAVQTKNEDRRVNDSLRLAVVKAHLGKYAEAIKTARTVFNAPPKESAPILMGVYIDLASVAKGHHQDLELAKLLEDAIAIEVNTSVDPNSQPGRDFIFARPTHINRTWSLIEELDHAANRDDLAATARQKQADMAASFAPNRVRF